MVVPLIALLEKKKLSLGAEELRVKRVITKVSVLTGKLITELLLTLSWLVMVATCNDFQKFSLWGQFEKKFGFVKSGRKLSHNKNKQQYLLTNFFPSLSKTVEIM